MFTRFVPTIVLLRYTYNTTWAMSVAICIYWESEPYTCIVSLELSIPSRKLCQQLMEILTYTHTHTKVYVSGKYFILVSWINLIFIMGRVRIYEWNRPFIDLDSYFLFMIRQNYFLWTEDFILNLSQTITS